MLGVEAFAKRVDGTCSDVAEDDAERRENEPAVARWGILVILSPLVGCAAWSGRLLVCVARDDLAKTVRHAVLLFPGFVTANARRPAACWSAGGHHRAAEGGRKALYRPRSRHLHNTAWHPARRLRPATAE